MGLAVVGLSGMEGEGMTGGWGGQKEDFMDFRASGAIEGLPS